MPDRFLAVTSLDTQTCLVTYVRAPDAVYRLLCAADACRDSGRSTHERDRLCPLCAEPWSFRGRDSPDVSPT